jgi:hypothetical protein
LCAFCLSCLMREPSSAASSVTTTVLAFRWGRSGLLGFRHDDSWPKCSGDLGVRRMGQCPRGKRRF